VGHSVKAVTETARDRLTARRPDCVSYIHLCVFRVAFDDCVLSGRAGTPLPELQLTGYIQASDTIELKLLCLWLDVKWDPVGSKLISHRTVIAAAAEQPQTCSKHLLPPMRSVTATLHDDDPEFYTGHVKNILQDSAAGPV
jgi:hypothetical protein